MSYVPNFFGKLKKFCIHCKIVGKMYYQESRGESFKAHVKKQHTYCLRGKKRTDNK